MYITYQVPGTVLHQYSSRYSITYYVQYYSCYCTLLYCTVKSKSRGGKKYVNNERSRAYSSARNLLFSSHHQPSSKTE